MLNSGKRASIIQLVAVAGAVMLTGLWECEALAGSGQEPSWQLREFHAKYATITYTVWHYAGSANAVRPSLGSLGRAHFQKLRDEGRVERVATRGRWIQIIEGQGPHVYFPLTMSPSGTAYDPELQREIDSLFARATAAQKVVLSVGTTKIPVNVPRWDGACSIVRATLGTKERPIAAEWDVRRETVVICTPDDQTTEYYSYFDRLLKEGTTAGTISIRPRRTTVANLGCMVGESREVGVQEKRASGARKTVVYDHVARDKMAGNAPMIGVDLPGAGRFFVPANQGEMMVTFAEFPELRVVIPNWDGKAPDLKLQITYPWR